MNHFALTLVTPPTEEPIDLATARAQCRVDLADDDPLIETYISAAREHVENVTGRQLITAEWTQVRDGFGGWIDMPKAPLRQVTGITYVDSNGVTQTLDPVTYKVLGATGVSPTGISPTIGRGRIELAYGQYWPIVRCEGGSVAVTFEAGYGKAAQVPMALRHAMLLLISHWYRNREPVNIGNLTSSLPMAFDALVGPYRTWALQGRC